VGSEYDDEPCQLLSSTEDGGISGILVRLSNHQLEAKMFKELQEVRLDMRNIEAVQSWEDRHLSGLEEQFMNNTSSQRLL
jgi:hypothetical protein